MAKVSEISQALQLAVQYHRANRLAEAEQVYRYILAKQPDQPDALYWLSVLARQVGEYSYAEQLLSAVLQVQPQSVKAWFSLGNLRKAQGQWPEAVEAYQQALALQPDSVALYNNLGATLEEQGKWSEALACYQKALDLQPECAEAEVNWANVLHAQGKLPSEKQAHYAALNNELGLSLNKEGNLTAAVACYRQAITLQPELANAHYNLGWALQQQDNLEEAIACYRQAIALQPKLASAHYNLGWALQEQGEWEEAIACYQQVLELNPDYGGVYNRVYNRVGQIYQEQNNLKKVVSAYQRGLNPINPYYALGNVLRIQGKLEEALESYQEALKLKPDCDRVKFGICMGQLPIIYSSFDEIQLRRNNYQHHLQNLAHSYQLANQKERAKAAEAVGSLQPFFLTYQGLNNRHLQQTYGEMICQLMASRYPQWSRPIELPALEINEKIRVGFVSGFFRRHSVWKTPLRGWVENLDRSKFELFGYHTDLEQDSETAVAARAFVKFIQGPLPVEKWCEVIVQDKLHVLIFSDFGMDPMTLKLGCLRLAPIQISTWGQAETTGLPTIDYHLSSELMEPEHGQDHYTEKLVRLPNLATYYTPLPIQPKAISKREIGLENDEIMFWCCQSIFKYLPQHDDVFPRIAQELGRCKFVFLSYESEQITQVFRQRLIHALGEFGLNYGDYCIFLPRNWDSLSFPGTTAIADIYLDSIGFSGANTTLDSIVYNLPVVTLPGDLMRGRLTMGILKMMGIEETIASSKEDYVKIAIRLGQDHQYRQRISEQVAQNKHKLYGDLRPIRALEKFLSNAVHNIINPSC